MADTVTAERQQIKDLYEEWKEIEIQKKALAKTQSEILKAYSKSREVQKADITKAFRAKRRLEEKNEDELDIVTSLFFDLTKD